VSVTAILCFKSHDTAAPFRRSAQACRQNTYSANSVAVIVGSIPLFASKSMRQHRHANARSLPHQFRVGLLVQNLRTLSFPAAFRTSKLASFQRPNDNPIAIGVEEPNVIL